MKASGIITLTTDFGLSDPYVAMMKGVILSINPDARLIDISHQIRVGAITQAAGIIRETYPFFPTGTVHVAVIDPTVGSRRRPIGLAVGGHLFVGPDNGIFWPVMEDRKDRRITHLNEGRYFLSRITHTFHGREVFAPVAAHLSLGDNLERMGPDILDPVTLAAKTASRKGKTYVGQVIRVDNFGNLITNIHREALKSFLGSARPMIKMGNLSIEGLSKIYADAKKGEPLALINSSDLLEIAINLGRADGYMGIKPEDTMGIEVKVDRT